MVKFAASFVVGSALAARVALAAPRPDASELASCVLFAYLFSSLLTGVTGKLRQWSWHRGIVCPRPMPCTLQ